MKKIFNILCLVFFITFFLGAEVFSQDVPEKVKSYSARLKKFASAQEIISAVLTQNSKKVPLEKIKELDKKWTETTGTDDFIKSVSSNKCSEYLKKITKTNPAVTEAFVMDEKGANVAMTNKTSDYWQGDEDKFIQSYNNGKGKVYYGKLSFDESAKTDLIQVSFPVIDKSKTIGVLTFGLDPSKIK